MVIRKFKETDAEAVSRLIIETVKVSNVKDYPVEMIEELVKRERPEDVLKRASWTHFYVVEADDRIVGCGAIGPYWDKQDESSLFTIFVLPAYQGKGIGRMIIETLERDDYALRARRIEIPASITGLPFYQKMGYTFKEGHETPDEELLYRLEKYTNPILNQIFSRHSYRGKYKADSVPREHLKAIMEAGLAEHAVRKWERSRSITDDVCSRGGRNRPLPCFRKKADDYIKEKLK